MRRPTGYDGEVGIRPSLIDSLTDLDPDRTEERPSASRESARKLRDSLRRDLENLLNTRERCLSLPEDLRELDRSVYSYGVEDLSGADLASKETRENFLQHLGQRIRAHDPRFHSVKVESLEGDDPHDRTLRLRIEALVKLDGGREDVRFDFRLEPVSRQFEAGA